MSPLDNTFWLTLTGSLIAQSAAVGTIAFIGERFLKSVFWRRTVWQVATICLLFAGVGELTGTRKAIALWLGGKPPVETKFNVKLVPGNLSAPVVSSSEESEATLIPTMTTLQDASPVFWPGAIWILGLSIVAVRIVFSQFLFILIRTRRNVPNDVLPVESIASRLGFRRRISLRESAGLSSPIAFGFIRPTIALPNGFSERFSPTQREVMLAHEVAHLASHDPAWYLAADLLTALFWWNPFIWLIRQRLHACSEAAADEAALVVENGPSTLAECLVALAQAFSRRKGFSWLGVEGNGFRSNLGKRVQRLLQLNAELNVPRGSRLVAVKVITPLLFVCVIVLCSAWREKDATRPLDFRSTVTRSWNDSPVLLAVNSVKPPNDGIESKGQSFVSPPPVLKTSSEQTNIQVHVSAKILRMRPNEGKTASDLISKLTDSITTNDILSEAQVKSLLVGLPYRTGFETLAMPRVITLSGREAEMGVFSEKTNAGTIYSEGIAVRVVPEARGELNELKIKFQAGNFSQSGKFIEGSGPTAQRTFVLEENETALLNCTNNTTNEYFILITAQRVTAEGLLKQQKKASPSNDRGLLSPAWDAAALAHEGQLLCEKGKFEEAKKKFALALEIDPECGAARYYLNLFRQGKLPRPAYINQLISVPDLLRDGQLLFEMGKLEEAEQKLQEVLQLNSKDDRAAYYLKLIEERKKQRSSTNQPRTAAPKAGIVYTSAGRQAILQKLKSTRIGQVDWKNVPFHEALKYLSQVTVERDPEKHGVNFVSTVKKNVTVTLSADDIPVLDVIESIVKQCKVKYSIEDYAVAFAEASTNEAPQLFGRVFIVSSSAVLENLKNLGYPQSSSKKAVQPDNSNSASTGAKPAKTTAAEAMLRDYFTSSGVDLTPPKSISFNESQGRLFIRASQADLQTISSAIDTLNTQPAPPANKDSTNLFSRSFKVKPRIVLDALERLFAEHKIADKIDESAQPQTRANQMIRNYLAAAGLELRPPKYAFFNDQKGIILVHGTEQDLDIAASAIEVVSAEPAQLTIGLRLAEIDEATSKKLGFDWFTKEATATSVVRSNIAVRPVKGILTDRAYRTVIKALEREKGVDLLTGPRVTTLSSRQAQIGLLDSLVKTTGVTRIEDVEAKSETYVTNATLSGITLDVIPNVSPDRYSIDLTLISSATEFLGYETLNDGTKQGHAQTHRFLANAKIWDGETIILGRMPAITKLNGRQNDDTRQIVAFVTTTIIDAAGNRIHTDDDLELLSERPKP